MHKEKQYYFPHDCNTSQQPNMVVLIQKYGYEGYGWYMVIKETLRGALGYRIPLDKHHVSYIQIRLHAEIGKLEAFLADCYDMNVFQSDGENIWCEALTESMIPLDDKRAQGKKAADIRWKKPKALPKPKKKFTIPTPVEVKEYALTIDFVLDGDTFCDFYSSKGWMVGRNDMRCWKSAVRTWKNQRKELPENKPRKLKDVTDELARQRTSIR
jgi:hypothetical protein